jgi:hypothetical protein
MQDADSSGLAGHPALGSPPMKRFSPHANARRRVRGVPDRTVISGESRSLTGTPCRRSPAAGQAI